VSKRVSLKDVARAANVSVATVSNFLNKTKAVGPLAQQQIEKAVGDLGYQRNEIASSLRKARTYTLGMILPNVANPFYTSLFEGAEAEAKQRGYALTLGVTHYDGATLRQYVSSFRGRQMDGIIIDGYNTDCGEEVLVGLAAPVVVIEPPASVRQHHTIEIDNRRAADEAVAYLALKGHRRIAIITPSITDSRSLGYRDALDRAGLAYDPDLVQEFGDLRLAAAEGSQQSLIQQGEASMQALLDRASFTACFITLDIFALGACKALRTRGLLVPQDVAVVGFDDIPVSAVVNPSLTTVAQPHREMGRLAVEVLLDRLARQNDSADPTHLVLPHELIIRESA
jgi:DNA-binding LacI/PurR family transcriptional regulator